MSELDWMEREERYRTRLTRTLVLLSLVAAAFFGTGFWVLNRQHKATELAEAEAAQAALLAKAAAARAAFAADSSAAAHRLSDFMAAHEMEVLEGAPILVVKIPRGRGVASFLGATWDEYVHAVEPEADAERVRMLFKLQYIDVMNRTWYNSRGKLVWEGENPPSAVLLPTAKQKGAEVEFEKPTFPQIVRGQQSAGIRVIEEEELLDGEATDSEVTQTTEGEPSGDATADDVATDDTKP